MKYVSRHEDLSSYSIKPTVQWRRSSFYTKNPQQTTSAGKQKQRNIIIAQETAQNSGRSQNKEKTLEKEKKKKEKTHTRINRLKFPSKELTAEEEDGNRLPDTLSLVGHHGCERWMRVWLWIYRRRRRLPPPPPPLASRCRTSEQVRRTPILKPQTRALWNQGLGWKNLLLRGTSRTKNTKPNMGTPGGNGEL